MQDAAQASTKTGPLLQQFGSLCSARLTSKRHWQHQSSADQLKLRQAQKPAHTLLQLLQLGSLCSATTGKRYSTAQQLNAAGQLAQA